MPFFSILMPSRNRGALLKDSIQTAMGQNCDDYEIIVSDNNSQDDTRQIVEKAMAVSDKVKYVHTGRDLSMCDNFEFALTQAQGEYILYLCDDDALVPGALRFLHQILSRPTAPPMDILVWQRGGYGHSDLPDGMNRHYLAFRLRSGNLYEVKSKLMLDALCDFDPTIHFVVPKTINCAISRRAFHNCLKKTERFFVPPYPDYTAICQLLSTHTTYHLIDLPLYLCGTSIQANSGIFFKRMQKVDEYQSLFGANEITLDDVPYPMQYLTASYLMATYLKFQKIYPETFDSPINPVEYFRTALKELIYYEHFEDVKSELEQLAGYMKTYSGSDTLFEQMSSELRKENNQYKLMYRLRMLAARNSVLRQTAIFAMRTLGFGRADARQYANVKTINEAAQILGRDLNLSARNGATLEPVPLASRADLPKVT